MKKRIYITVPNGDGWLHKHVHFAICRMLGDQRCQIRHDCPTHSPYINNLHYCMNDFLKGGEDFWLSIDADNPPIKNPLDLVELDCDLIGCPTPVWCNKVKGDRPWYFNALKWIEEEQGYQPYCEETKGLKEVDAVGSGCFLVARRVISKLKDQQPFMRQWKKDGTVEMGGDYSFCQKVKAAGFKVWTHFDYPCHHFNEVSLIEVIEAINNMEK